MVDQVMQDSDEFVELMTSYQGRLYGFILSLLADPDAANDVLQETNLVLWRKSSEFELGSSFKAWAFRVAGFQVMAYRQRRLRDRLVFDDSFYEELVHDASKVDDVYEARWQALQTCIGKLNDRYRSLVTRRYANGATVEGMAEELEQTAGSIAQALFRARQNLINCVKRSVPGEAFAG